MRGQQNIKITETQFRPWCY